MLRTPLVAPLEIADRHQEFMKTYTGHDILRELR